MYFIESITRKKNLSFQYSLDKKCVVDYSVTNAMITLHVSAVHLLLQGAQVGPYDFAELVN